MLKPVGQASGLTIPLTFPLPFFDRMVRKEEKLPLSADPPKKTSCNPLRPVHPVSLAGELKQTGKSEVSNEVTLPSQFESQVHDPLSGAWYNGSLVFWIGCPIMQTN
jgi:hypothetical protein